MSSGTGFLIVLSILSASGLFTLWQTRRNGNRDWRADLRDNWGTAAQDEAAIDGWTEEHERQWRASQPTR